MTREHNEGGEQLTPTGQNDSRNQDGSPHAFSRRTVLGTMAAGIAGVGATSSPASAGPTFTAVRNGPWSDPATWDSDTVPTDGSTVFIQSGVTVTLDGETARLITLDVEGTLRADPQIDAHVTVETLTVATSGRLELGTENAPVQSTVRVTFIDTGEFDYMGTSRGLMVMGDITVHGQEKTTWTSLAEAPVTGDTTISLQSEPTGWNVGDELMLPGVNPSTDEDERRTITTIDGTTVTLDSALSHDHAPPRSNLDAYVLNMTRTVAFESEAEFWQRRGHVMVMSEVSDFRYVSFNTLGRTNKNLIPTQDNPRGDENVPADATPNPRARYPLHWHRTGIGIDTPHYVEGAVVEDSPGWGIVNHHTYVDVVDSITYDVDGAGFVSEGGNERGSFKRCFALRSSGSGETIDARAFGDHGGDPAVDDFGHAGHGFWMQSPLVELVGNVAAGHRHQGMVYWTRPLLDEIEDTAAECDEVLDSRVVFCPNVPIKYVEGQEPMLEAIEQQRFSTDSKDKLMWDTQKVPSCFVRLKKCAHNTIFASAGGMDLSRLNFKWKHERFSEFSVIDDLTIYNIGQFVDADGDVHEPKPPRHMASGHQGRGGSTGLSLRYVSNVTVRNSTFINDGLENSVALPFHDYRWTHTIDNCTIEGWDWGVATGEHRLSWVRNNSFSDNNHDIAWTFDNVGPAILEGNDLSSVWQDFTKRNQKASEVFGFSQKYGVRIDGRTAYVEESTPDYVPFPDEDSLGGINNIEDIDTVDDETALVGLTNAEMYDQFDIAIGGRPMPTDAVSEPWLDGLLIDPEPTRDTSAWLDMASADFASGWTVVDEPDAAGGTALYCLDSDDPETTTASTTFEVAEGTYTLWVRAWPDALNGDTVRVRIDDGDWLDAEKLKPANGFEWHDVEPNGGEPYQVDLVAGEHTLEIACDNDGVLVDEVFVTSDATVLGAHGNTSTVTEDTFSVSTETPSVDSATSATLNGTLDDLGGASSVDAAFEWRQVGANEWNTTMTETLSSTGSYSAVVDGLQEGVDYEYRAFGEASDGDVDTGSIVTFTTTDNPPAVTTGSASSIDAESASLDGTLNDLGNAESVDVYFDYRETGASSWSTTASETRSNTGSFSVDVTGLSSDTEHEFRAAGDASDGDSDTGTVVAFTTDSQQSDSAPSIDSYTVTEAGSPNPHAEITADWSVSDADGNLDSVEVTVVDSSGRAVNSAATGASGASASGTDTFKIKHADGQTFDVTVTVTDTTDRQRSATQTVTE